MKKIKNPTKLKLHRDTLRALNAQEVHQGVGGNPSPTLGGAGCHTYLGTCVTPACPLN